MNVLIVGDKSHERTPVARAVARFGHEVVEAGDGFDAWEQFSRTHYDVIISDYLMPQMNGLELCRKVRLGPHQEYTYFIIVSARNQADNVLAGFRSGVDDYLAKPVRELDLECRLLSAERVTKTHRALAQSNAQLLLLSNELKIESRRDALTGAGNRLKFQDDLGRFLDEAERYDHRFFLGLCDIDNFKRYNDTYGHLEGDRVLKSVARTLMENCRASDACYRYGGEEFLLVFANQEEPGAAVAAERLRLAVEKLGIEHKGNPPHGKVTLSIGISRFTARSQREVDDCLKSADEALYRSKSEGKNRVSSAHDKRGASFTSSSSAAS